jgi:rod shape determining protein RodA
MTFREKLLSVHWPLLVLTLVLAGIGLIAVYSATYMRTGMYGYLSDATSKQAVFMALGVAAMLIIMFIDYRWWRYLAWPGYIVSVGLLGFLYVAGETGGIDLGIVKSKEVYNAVSWLEVGSGGTTIVFQPSQLAILCGILVISLIYTQYRHRHPVFKIILGGLLVAIPAYLIMEQPDNGSMLVWAPVFLTLMFLGDIPLRYLVVIIVAGLAALPLAYQTLDPYAQQRLIIFTDPYMDPNDSGWNTIQSLIAVGSAGWEGKGFLATGTQNSEGFLPPTIAHNDFIFAVIAEEHGFRGAFPLVLLLGLFLFFCVFIGTRSRDQFGLLLVGGITAQLFAHMFMNIGMTIQLTPITGLPLPLISYGGTFLFLTLVSLGMIQSVYIHRNVGRGLKPPVNSYVASDEELKPAPEEEKEHVLTGV